MIGDKYLLPITIFFLLLAVGMLAFRAKKRWGYIPLVIGTIGSAAIVSGKFYYENNYVGYAGTILLIAASLWNAWPRKKISTPWFK